MAKLKKYPKKPKASASVTVLENYLRRVAEIDKENAQIKKDVERKKQLQGKISKIGRAR